MATRALEDNKRPLHKSASQAAAKAVPKARAIAAEKHLRQTDIRHMRSVFNRRNTEEKAAAKVEKKIRLKH